jgi:hypothetical protein
MAAMLQQLANVPIGTQWRSMSKNKVNPKQNSGSSNYFKFDTLQFAEGSSFYLRRAKFAIDIKNIMCFKVKYLYPIYSIG